MQDDTIIKIIHLTNCFRHVDAQPAWAKHLQARLAAGVHRISFRARSPYAANVIEVCRTVITVKPATAAAVTSPVTPIGPAVSFCPGIIEVQLQPNERARIVHWKEPAFRSHYQLKQLFKTKPSGSQFAAGVHRITYIATDVNNQNARCDFTINIKPATREWQWTDPNGNHIDLVCLLQHRDWWIQPLHLTVAFWLTTNRICCARINRRWNSKQLFP